MSSFSQVHAPACVFRGESVLAHGQEIFQSSCTVDSTDLRLVTNTTAYLGDYGFLLDADEANSDMPAETASVLWRMA